MSSPADLTTIRERTAKLQLKLTEAAFDFYANLGLLDPRELQAELGDGFGWYPSMVPPYYVQSQKRGEVLPVYLNDWQLLTIRDRCRKIAMENEFAICGTENRISYVVGDGFQYKAVAKRKDTPDELLRKVQTVADAFVEVNNLADIESDAMRRLDTDGDAFYRFFPHKSGLLLMRCVEPEHIRPPNGANYAPEYSFGVQTDADDVETIVGYWVVERPLRSWVPVFVPADEILHLKLNTHRNAKRGLPTWYAVEQNLRRAHDLLGSMTAMAKTRAKIALIRKFNGTLHNSAAAMLDRLTDAKATDPLSGSTINLEQLRLGTILNSSGNIDYEMPSADVQASDFVEVLQAELRAIAGRLCMPEWMLTVNASNANYSSSLIAEAPSTKAFRRLQRYLCRCFGESRNQGRVSAVWRQLYHAMRQGILPHDLPRHVEVQCEAPSLVVRDKGQEATVNKTYYDLRIKSPQTISAELGLDREQEVEHFKQLGIDPTKPVSGGPAQQPPASPAGTPGSPVQEELKVGKDKLGRRFCTDDGKRVKCPQNGDDAKMSEPAASKPSNASASSEKPKIPPRRRGEKSSSPDELKSKVQSAIGDGVSTHEHAISVGQHLAEHLDAATSKEAKAFKAARDKLKRAGIDAAAVKAEIHEAGDKLVAARRSALQKALAAVRPTGLPEGGAKVTGSGKATQYLEEASQFYPREWWEASNAAGGMRVVDRDPAGNELGEYLRDDHPPEIKASSPTVMAHELAHRFEHAMPAIADMEGQLFNAVAKGAIEHGGMFVATGFNDSYMGRVYLHNAYEIMSRGVERLISTPEGLDDEKPEVKKFVLGMLAGFKPSTKPQGPPTNQTQMVSQATDDARHIQSRFGKLLGVIGKAGGWIRNKAKAVFAKLEGRYGRNAAIGIFAAGHVVGLASPLVVVPGSTIIGMAPFVAMAETFLQAKRGFNKLRGRESRDLTPEQLRQLGAKLIAKLKSDWERRSVQEACVANKTGPGHHDDGTGKPCSMNAGTPPTAPHVAHSERLGGIDPGKKSFSELPTGSVVNSQDREQQRANERWIAQATGGRWAGQTASADVVAPVPDKPEVRQGGWADDTYLHINGKLMGEGNPKGIINHSAHDIVNAASEVLEQGAMPMVVVTRKIAGDGLKVYASPHLQPQQIDSPDVHDTGITVKSMKELDKPAIKAQLSQALDKLAGSVPHATAVDEARLALVQSISRLAAKLEPAVGAASKHLSPAKQKAAKKEVEKSINGTDKKPSDPGYVTFDRLHDTLVRGQKMNEKQLKALTKERDAATKQADAATKQADAVKELAKKALSGDAAAKKQLEQLLGI